MANVVTSAKLETLKVPTLLMTGAANLATPPSITRMIAQHVPDNESRYRIRVRPIYWEQPEFFNRTILKFIGRYP